MPDIHHPVVMVSASGAVEKRTSFTNVAIMPGSFNPVHHGHRRLQQIAERMLGLRVVFEISVTNVEKPSLTPMEIRNRLRPLRNDDVVLTLAPFFADKAKLFPGCPFVVGFDTAQRVVDPAYYDDNPATMRAVLETFATHGHRFLVGGRLRTVDTASEFGTVADLAVPAGFTRLFEGIPEQQFRADISSSRLRAEQTKSTESG